MLRCVCRLVSSFVAKTADADVITVDQMWSGQYLDNGWIIPLDDRIRNDKAVDLGDFIPLVLHSSNIWKGRFGHAADRRPMPRA